jgi:hypothetical protein
MAHGGSTYVIVPFAEVTQAMISVCQQDSFDTLRHTTEGEDLVILKWPLGTQTPAILSGYDQFTHAEILAEIQKPEWNVPDSSSSS